MTDSYKKIMAYALVWGLFGWAPIKALAQQTASSSFHLVVPFGPYPPDYNNGGESGDAEGDPGAPEALSIELTEHPLIVANRDQPFDFELTPLLVVEGDPHYNQNLVTWDISPSLPEGLVLTSGRLSGTPIAEADPAEYTVTAQYKGEVANRVYELEVEYPALKNVDKIVLLSDSIRFNHDSVRKYKNIKCLRSPARVFLSDCVRCYPTQSEVCLYQFLCPE